MDKKLLTTYLRWINLPNVDQAEVLELLYRRGVSEGKIAMMKQIYPDVKVEQYARSDTNK